MKTLADTLWLTAALLRECYLYKGYQDGPATQPAVKMILDQIEFLRVEMSAKMSAPTE